MNEVISQALSDCERALEDLEEVAERLPAVKQDDPRRRQLGTLAREGAGRA